MEGFKLHRRNVAERAVQALGVVEVLDPLGDGDRQLDLGPPPLPVEQFDLHRAPERLHRGIVVAVADGAHRAQEAVLADELAEAPRRELTAVVRMYDRGG